MGCGCRNNTVAGKAKALAARPAGLDYFNDGSKPVAPPAPAHPAPPVRAVPAPVSAPARVVPQPARVVRAVAQPAQPARVVPPPAPQQGPYAPRGHLTFAQQNYQKLLNALTSRK